MSQVQEAAERHSEAGPHLGLLHAAMLLSGFGTVFLGPSLPALAAAAHASDSGSGLFFTAQFAGAFLGGVTTSQRLWLCLLRGLGAATAGFAGLAACTGWHASVMFDLLALFALGFGVGQMLTSVNLLTSQRFREGRTAALALVNFSWSLGAVCAPFLLGLALSSFPLAPVLGVAAALFLLTLLATAWDARGRTGRVDRGVSDAGAGLPARAFAVFAAMLLIYGGVETCLGGWIPTFATRYAGATLRVASLDVTALWIGITAGRALTPLLLRAVRDRVLLVGALLVSTAVAIALSRATGTVPIAVLAAVLGLAMAPWFPLVLAAMLNGGASARQVGVIIALSGIGAAVLPAVLGAVSSGTGSLRVALAVPVMGLVFLVVLAILPQPKSV